VSQLTAPPLALGQNYELVGFSARLKLEW